MATLLNFRNKAENRKRSVNKPETDFDKVLKAVKDDGYKPAIEKKDGLIFLKYSDAFMQKCDMFTTDGKYIISMTKEIEFNERVHMAAEKLFDRLRRYCRDLYLRVRYAKSKYQCAF